MPVSIAQLLVHSRGAEVVLLGQLNLVHTWTWSYSSMTRTYSDLCGCVSVIFAIHSLRNWCVAACFEVCN